MGRFDDLLGDGQAATRPRNYPVDRSFGNTRAPRERCIRLVHSLDVCAQSHAVIFNGLSMRAQAKNDGSVTVDSALYPSGMEEEDAIADLSLARQVAQRLYPPGEATKAATRMGIKPRTFQWFLSGQNLKATEWTRLVSYPHFAEAFAKEKGLRAPKLDRITQEAMGRLARALGPDRVKEAVYEIENVAAAIGAQKTLAALVRLKETVAEVAESVAELSERQKSS